MATVSTADFRNGMCIVNNGKMCTIVEFQHVKPGKGGAFVRTKLKDIKTGRVVDYTFNAGTKFDSVRLESKKMQYLYNDGADFYFMDNDTYEQLPVAADVVGGAADWLKENDEATLLYAGDEKIIGAKVGDKLEFDFEAKDEEGGSEYGDGELHAEVEVKGFRRMVLPEVDDALASKVGCTDVADMRKQMTYTINEQKSRELPKLMVDRAIDALIERLDGEVPGYYVDFIRQDVGRELMQGLQQQGTNLQQWMLENSINGDDMKEDVAREAARRAAIDCALEALFVEKGMEVTDEDIAKMFVNEEDPEATLQQWKDANRMADIHKMCRHTKATEWLVDNADVTVVED